MDTYDLVVPKDNLLRKLNNLVDFSFVYDELRVMPGTRNYDNTPTVKCWGV
jgi:hypothetical protein